MADACAEWFAAIAKTVGGLGETGLKGLDSPKAATWGKFADRGRETLTPLVIAAVLHGIKEARTDERFGALDSFVNKLDKKKAKRKPVKVDWSLVNRDAETFARDYAYDLITGITETTVADTQAAISRWIEAGNALDDLKQSLTTIFASPARAEMIAQTESTRAFAEGNTRAWVAAKVPARRWFTVRDGDVCEICDPLHGKVVPLGKPFKSIDGDIDNPPAHPRCRCYVQPAFED